MHSLSALWWKGWGEVSHGLYCVTSQMRTVRPTTPSSPTIQANLFAKAITRSVRQTSPTASRTSSVPQDLGTPQIPVGANLFANGHNAVRQTNRAARFPNKFGPTGSRYATNPCRSELVREGHNAVRQTNRAARVPNKFGPTGSRYATNPGGRFYGGDQAIIALLV